MLVVYRKDSLLVEQVIHIHADNYTEWLDQQPNTGWIDVETELGPQDLVIVEVAGVIGVTQREIFGFTPPATTPMGQEFLLAPIPEGTTCYTPDGVVTMDATQTLELTFTDPGTYVLRFDNRLYYPKECSIEAVAQ